MKKITLLLLMFCASFSFAQLQVGVGTNEAQNMPFEAYYGYSYSQSIYTASQINSSGTITGLQYYFSGTSALPNSQDLTIYIGHTTRTNFADGSDWEPVAGLTASYTGGIDVSAGPGWVTLTLDTPFAYNGTDNLLIGFDENNAGYDSSGDDFWNSATPEVRSITYRNDNTNPDPAAPPTASGTYSFSPTIIFNGLVAALPPNCDATLTTPTDGEMNADLTAGLAWSAATGSATGYKVTMGTSTGATDIANAVDVGTDLTYAVTLTAGTTYFATITPYNANGDATGCTEATFTAASAPMCPVVTATPDAACGNYDSNISWVAIAGADSYTVTVGTSTGATDIADNVDVGTALTYDFASMAATDYFYTVNAVNTAGTSTGCAEGSFITFATGCYCDSDTTSVDGTGITNLQVGSTDFASGGTLGYEDFTGAPVDLGQGTTSNVQITYDTGYDYGVNIWIDFNDNFTFEVSEQVFMDGLTASDSPTTFDASFTMPAAAVLGTHRMRISSDDTPAQATACNMSTWHVTMDVDVNIIAVACTAPTGTATLVTDCDNAQFSVDVDITGLGDGTSQINDGTTTYAATALGIVTVGPYADASSVTLVLENGTDPTCDINLGTFTNTCPPANDTCAGVIDLGTQMSPLSASTVNANNDFGSFDCFNTNNESPDIVYSILVPDGYTLTIGQTANSYDSEHRLGYGGACPGTTSVACTDDSDLTIESWANGTGADETAYWIQSAYSNGSGTFTLEWSLAATPPANDDCAAATVAPHILAVGTLVNGDTTNATDSGVAAGACGATGGDKDIWYSFVATATMVTEGANFTTDADHVVVYSGDCATANEIACLATGENTPVLIDGTTYLVRVYNSGIAKVAGPVAITLNEGSLSTRDFDSTLGFSYYPNPVNNTLTLNAQKAISNVAVFNMLGQEVIRTAPNAVSKVVDMSNLQSGAYFVQVTVGSTVETVRVIKN
ncbi:T9SS type A sorting domain-containing protein [Lacinutrix sp. Bg11-31]|uniref:T9SS type A sorting domain-containing protein n=1 Tax=Lacinutrix sp. Bg11-31 TaxID=2057808 RepID=UPI000C30E007|nr:T9SS type A sorting domain-containing protein [Lacinutrix sp. Bg11-31]AUC81911.1 hypothetical protein CW733_07120 [Lacinutrix sp. Bg11-31]